MINAGRLKHHVTIQERTEVADGMGGFTVTWATVDTVWAEIKPLRGSQLLQADMVQSKIEYKISTRYRSDIKSSHRISYKDRIFTIVSIVNIDELGEVLELYCKEQPAT